MELLIFGHGGPRMLIFPTRGGRFFEYENMGLVERLRPELEGGRLQLFCTDGIDAESLYCASAHPHDRIQRHLQYESYILHEVLPLMDRINPNDRTVAHGCSLGAFHAANIAFRHPHRFSQLIAFSGRYDLTANLESFRDLFDGYYSDDIYYNTPAHYLPGLNCAAQLEALKKIKITLVVGDGDPFRESNERLSQILWAKDVWHALHYWPGRAHRACFWREMTPHIISI